MNRIYNINKKVNEGVKKVFYQLDDDVVVEVKCGRKKVQFLIVIILVILDGEIDDILYEQKKELKELCLRGLFDLRKVKYLMDIMFFIRRKSILIENMRVWEFVKDYLLFEFNFGSEVNVYVYIVQFCLFIL